MPVVGGEVSRRVVVFRITVSWLVDGFKDVAIDVLPRASKVPRMDERLREACRRGDLVEATRLVKEEGVHVETKDQNGRTPLMYLCWFGNASDSGVRCLVEELGADVNARSKKQRTALMHYCQRESASEDVMRCFSGRRWTDPVDVLLLAWQRD